jgi:hypothetical protein
MGKCFSSACLRVFWRNLSHLKLPQPRSFWAYEYCHLEHAKQFHSPANSKGHVHPPGNDPENKNFVNGVEYVLGRFNGDNQIPTSEVAEARNKDVLLRTAVHTIGQRSYLSQKWRFGDKCDITGKPREIEIQVCVYAINIPLYGSMQRTHRFWIVPLQHAK